MDDRTDGRDGAGGRSARARTDPAAVVPQAHPAAAPGPITASPDELDRLADGALTGSTDERPGRADVLLALAGLGLVVGALSGVLTGPWPALGVMLLVLAGALPAMQVVRAAADRRRLRPGRELEEPAHADG
jgi:Flp pilus assembly protein TadB